MDGKIISFSASEADEGAVTPQGVRQALEALYRQREELDEAEPREGTESYDRWADAHEALEDEIDDLLDWLDELEGQ